MNYNYLNEKEYEERNEVLKRSGCIKENKFNYLNEKDLEELKERELKVKENDKEKELKVKENDKEDCDILNKIPEYLKLGSHLIALEKSINYYKKESQKLKEEINEYKVENKKLKEDIKDYKELQKLIQKLGKSITMKI